VWDSIDFFDVGEVPCAVVLAIPCNASVVELFDPLGWDVRPLPKGDSERGEPLVSYIPLWRFDKGLLLVEET